ncbi:MAG: trehalose 2-sulfotransferase [Gaiellaceae bacterium]|nr:trehalose 2-sulfotransferase [Gaiellaceae bacterium]
MAHDRAIERSLLICFVARSGSWFLSGLLASTGVAGRPSEAFFPRIEEEARVAHSLETDRDYLEWVLQDGSTANGAFGCKLMWSELQDVLGRLRRIDGEESEARLMAGAFPNPRYVWLRRRDVVAQAVSWARALQTQQWQSYRSPVGEPRFDFAEIDGLVGLVKDEEEAWATWFETNDIAAVQVFYEDLLADPFREVSRIVATLGLELPGTAELRPYPGFDRQADAVSADWCERYHVQSASGPTGA